MIEYFAEEILSEQEQQQIFELLMEADQEFIPSLSARYSTTQKALRGVEETKEHIPLSYLKHLLNQRWILAKDEGQITGFLSYCSDFVDDILGIEQAGDYISTIIVQKDYRGRGITVCMYNKLFEISKAPWIATRTWSTNYAHIHILQKLKFDLVKRIPNDRGVGIDTVYFQKKLKINKRENLI